jgi:hypothetical protein
VRGFCCEDGSKYDIPPRIAKKIPEFGDKPGIVTKKRETLI